MAGVKKASVEAREIAESSMAAARPCALALIPRLPESGLFSRLIEVRRACSWGSVRCRSSVAFLTQHFGIVETTATIAPLMVDFKIARSCASRHYRAPLKVHNESLIEQPQKQSGFILIQLMHITDRGRQAEESRPCSEFGTEDRNAQREQLMVRRSTSKKALQPNWLLFAALNI